MSHDLFAQTLVMRSLLQCEMSMQLAPGKDAALDKCDKLWPSEQYKPVDSCSFSVNVDETILNA